MSHIHSVLSDVPAYNVSQIEFYEVIAPRIRPRLRSIFKRILTGSQIRKRHFGTTLEHIVEITEGKSVEEKFSIWKASTMEFWTQQAIDILANAGLAPDEIDGVCTCTTSGFVTPDPAILIQSEIGLRKDIIRMPLFGFGCSGGQAAIHRVNEYLTSFPEKAFLVFVGESCGTQYETTDSVSVLVSNSIFGDGFSTMLMVGNEHRLAEKSQVELLNSKSIIFPNCDFAIGQWMSDEGIHTHLDAKLPRLVSQSVKAPLDQLFEEAQVDKTEIDYWMCHAGGPKVMEAFGETLSLNDEALNTTMETYRDFGNQSAVSVITTMKRFLEQNTKTGYGFMMALGPGIHMEYCLARVTPRSENSRADLSRGHEEFGYSEINATMQVI